MEIHKLVLAAHVLISMGIIGLVMIQRGKGADAGAAFGSGASGTVFGAKGSANFLSRSTAVLATLFFVSSLVLAYLGSQRPEATSILDTELGFEEPAAVAPTPDLPSIDPEAADVLPALPEVPAAPNEEAAP